MLEHYNTQAAILYDLVTGTCARSNLYLSELIYIRLLNCIILYCIYTFI